MPASRWSGGKREVCARRARAAQSLRQPRSEPVKEKAMSTHVSSFRFDSITRYLSWDHDRLDGLLGEVTRHVEDGHFVQASSIFSTFDQGLRRHIRLEEELLFPLFECRTGMRNGPTAVMRNEHRQI